MSYVTVDTLVSLRCSRAKATEMLPRFNQKLDEYGITDPAEIAMLLGQFAHESGSWMSLTELAPNSRTTTSTYRGRGIGQLTHLEAYQMFTNYVNARLPYYGRTTRVDFVSRPQDVNLMPFAVDSGFYMMFDFYNRATLTREALRRRDVNMLGLVLNHPASAAAIASGRRPTLSKPNGATDRENRTEAAMDLVQQDYIAYNNATRQSMTGPGYGVVAAGGGAGAGDALSTIVSYIGGLFKAKPAAPVVSQFTGQGTPPLDMTRIFNGTSPSAPPVAGPSPGIPSAAQTAQAQAGALGGIPTPVTLAVLGLGVLLIRRGPTKGARPDRQF